MRRTVPGADRQSHRCEINQCRKGQVISSALYAPLVVLALIDSTSFGTLVIPICFMLAPGRLRAGRILLYLFTIAVFYLVLGVLLTVGAMAFLDQSRGVLGRTPAHVLQLLVGIVLLVLGLTVEPLTKPGKAKRAGKRDAKRAERGPDRIQRWRVRATTGEGSASGLMILAVTAAAIEAASMVPYLACRRPHHDVGALHRPERRGVGRLLPRDGRASHRASRNTDGAA